ncbi:hypothetical protein [Azospirillum sp. TSO22-1]|uniref:hypothetical protein n=1 Tax=Azospirillum sp. TSO22-1 TaxID=716789 RepID=UPI000D61B205|nr:hypothetical protein [Azospirillum sp. TSO22-1]PWC52380.1 hypothetical protein TSO221_14545 [Azospirillum sp. TSO22-1]
MSVRMRAVVTTVAFACLFALLLAPLGPARADNGCPKAGTFPDPWATHKTCLPVSPYNRLPLDDEQPMTFAAIQISASITYIQGTGIITEDTPNELRKFLKNRDGPLSSELYLHSRDGHVGAALELGWVIRSARLHTNIGRAIPLAGIMKVYDYPEALCLTACAYAFLGGVTRHYGDRDVFGVNRFGRASGAALDANTLKAGDLLATYIRDMGVDASAFEVNSISGFEKDISTFPVKLAEKAGIIFDSAGRTRFWLEERNGSNVAAFYFTQREREYDGLVLCSGGERVLLVFDTADSLPALMRTMKKFPAKFRTGDGRTLPATATYVPASVSPNSVAYVGFRIPDLDERGFSGDGLMLDDIENPNLKVPPQKGAPSGSGATADRFAWWDAVAAFAFSIAADNAPSTLPAVLRDCGSRRGGRI